MVFNAILKKYVVLLILYLNMYCDIAIGNSNWYV